MHLQTESFVYFSAFVCRKSFMIHSFHILYLVLNFSPIPEGHVAVLLEHR